MNILPEAPYNQIMGAREAELVKYAGNCFLYTKVAFMNILYDLVSTTDSDWEAVRDALIADPRIGSSHTQPVHVSGHDTDQTKVVRGAGGHCFIKDYEAMRRYLAEHSGNTLAVQALTAYQDYNNQLLRDSGKDLDLLRDVHGE
jgi:UDPglucose 6-dehydrogenase